MIRLERQVRIVHGCHDDTFAVAGYSVETIRRSLRYVFNIAADAKSLVNGWEVKPTHRLVDGDVLEFVRPWGRKAALEPDELARLERIEQLLKKMESWVGLIANQRVIKDWYSTKEIAEILGKREYTVREWCRLRRVNGQKVAGGRGNEGEWRICHDELLRIQNHGLLPVPSRY